MCSFLGKEFGQRVKIFLEQNFLILRITIIFGIVISVNPGPNKSVPWYSHVTFSFLICLSSCNYYKFQKILCYFYFRLDIPIWNNMMVCGRKYSLTWKIFWGTLVLKIIRANSLLKTVANVRKTFSPDTPFLIIFLNGVNLL